MEILKINHLSKSFGSKAVLRDLTLSVPTRGVFGFVGKNGAGKTTTMKMILGLLPADQGEILIDGEPVVFGRSDTNRFVGYLPDVPEFYDFLTAAEYLTLCGKITGMNRRETSTRSGELLELVGLSSETHRIRGFSRGMKQRLGIAQALLHRPKLLICDEPTSALDPIGRKETLDILSSVKEDTTVLFSTHILSDVERICDRIAILQDGRIAACGTPEEMKGIRNGSRFEIEFRNAGDTDRYLTLFPDGKKTTCTRLLYENRSDSDMPAMMNGLLSNRIPIVRFEQLEPTLEDLFLEVAGQ